MGAPGHPWGWYRRRSPTPGPGVTLLRVTRLLTAFLIVVAACAQQPPERSPLPDVEDVLPEPVGCQLSVGEPRGAEVQSVAEGSPAQGALSEGDVIVSLSGEPVADAEGLVTFVGRHQTGEEVEVVYERGDTTASAKVVLASSPSDGTKPYLGVTIRTDFETIPPESAEGLVEPGATARSLEIGGTIYVFDPLELVWQDTGIGIPEGLNWMATSTGFYATTDDNPAVLFDLVSEEELDHDGFLGWEPRRLIGSLGNILIMVVTSEIAEQPGFINIALAAFDPTAGATLWVSPVLTGFGVPVTAYGSPDGLLFVAVGTDQDTGEEIGVEIYDTNGTIRSRGQELIELGTPIGWFDGDTIVFRSDDEIVSLLNPTTGSTSTLTLPPGLLETPLSAVGDGRHVLAVEGRNLLIDDLTTESEVRVLADDCALGSLGTPGWGT